jgi:flagellar biosynthetic protein FliO
MEALQQTFAVLFVLGVLFGSLFWLRRRGLAQLAWKGARGAGSRKIQLVERLPLSTQHSLHLVRIGERELLIGVSPGGCTVLESSPTAAPERNFSR